MTYNVTVVYTPEGFLVLDHEGGLTFKVIAAQNERSTSRNCQLFFIKHEAFTFFLHAFGS